MFWTLTYSALNSRYQMPVFLDYIFFYHPTNFQRCSTFSFPFLFPLQTASDKYVGSLLTLVLRSGLCKDVGDRKEENLHILIHNLILIHRRQRYLSCWQARSGPLIKWLKQEPTLRNYASSERGPRRLDSEPCGNSW